MKTEYLKFPRTYADLERNHFENAPYIHAVWKLTKYKWGEGVQLPFNTYYFPQDPDHENWNLFGNCQDYNDNQSQNPILYDSLDDNGIKPNV